MPPRTGLHCSSRALTTTCASFKRGSSFGTLGARGPSATELADQQTHLLCVGRLHIYCVAMSDRLESTKLDAPAVVALAHPLRSRLLSALRTDGAATATTLAPGPCATTPRWQGPWRARCGESRTPSSASGLGKRTGSNLGTAPQADSTDESGRVSVP